MPNAEPLGSMGTTVAMPLPARFGLLHRLTETKSQRLPITRRLELSR